MRKRFRGNQPLLMMMATILLFGAAIGYNKLQVNHFLAGKKIFPEGIPELTEHNQSQASLVLETIKLDKDLAMVLGAADEEDISNLKLKILNGTKITGLAAAAKEFFTENGFTSIVIGNAPKATSSATLVKFQPEAQEWAEFIHYLINKDLEIEINKIEKAASGSAELDFDIIIILATNSTLFEPYLPESVKITPSPTITPTATLSATPSARDLTL